MKTTNQADNIRHFFLGHTASLADMRALIIRLLAPLLLLQQLVLLVATPDVSGTFVVKFNTHRALGLKLSPSLEVIGFHRERANVRMPAEATGWVKPGDLLISVNDHPVGGLPLADVSRLIAKAELPKILRLRPAKGEDRAATMAASSAALEPDEAHNHDGVLEVYKQGSPVAMLRFAQAAFGGRAHCNPGLAVLSDPPAGCQAYRNQREMMKSIAIVRRGVCSFSDKAILAQSAGAIGVVVVNSEDGGELINMPGDPAERTEVTIPAVMVSHADGEALLSRMREGPATVRSDVLARLVQDGVACKPLYRPAAAAGGEKKKGDAAATGTSAATAAKAGGRRAADASAERILEDSDELSHAGGELLVFLEAPSPASRQHDGSSGSSGDANIAVASAKQAKPSTSTAAAAEFGSYDDGGKPVHTIDDGHGHLAKAAEAGNKARRLLVERAGSGAGTGSGRKRPIDHTTSGTSGDASISPLGDVSVGQSPSSSSAADGPQQLTPEEQLLHARHAAAGRFEYLKASFGPQALLPQGGGGRVRLALALPTDACGEQLEAPFPGYYAGAAVLVDRGGCSFEVKRRNAAMAGAVALLVANNEVGLTRMQSGGASQRSADDIEIPAAMVTRSAGRELRHAMEHAAATGGNVTMLSIDHPDTARHWAELELLLSPDAGVWPNEDLARRKAYTRFAKLHHPDKPTGSQDRFEALRFAYAAANHLAAPDRFSAPDSGG